MDIATGWVACRAVLGEGQQRVGGAIHHIGQNLPFPLLGLDSDNGSEFINRHFSLSQRSSCCWRYTLGDEAERGADKMPLREVDR